MAPPWRTVSLTSSGREWRKWRKRSRSRGVRAIQESSPSAVARREGDPGIVPQRCGIFDASHPGIHLRVFVSFEFLLKEDGRAGRQRNLGESAAEQGQRRRIEILQ